MSQADRIDSNTRAGDCIGSSARRTLMDMPWAAQRGRDYRLQVARLAGAATARKAAC